MSWMPDVARIPTAFHGGIKGKGRALVLHVAVSESPTLTPNANKSWHFYVAKNGRIIQYVNTDFQAWTGVQANGTCVQVETQGGVINANGEPWTPEQVESLAQIYAFCHEDEGIPLQFMLNSRPESRGLGSHRLGIDPWRAFGGELWSSSVGKICPGDAKIGQLSLILNRAKVLVSNQGKDDGMSADPAVIALLQSIRDESVKNRNSLDHIESIVGGIANRDVEALAALQAIVAKLPAPPV